MAVDAPSRGIPLGDVIKVPLPPERPGSPERVLALMGQHAAGFGKIKKFLQIPSGKSPTCTRGSGKAKPICLVSPAVRCEREGCPISATVARWCGFPLPTGIESRSSLRHAPFRKIPGMGHTGGRTRRVARSPTHNATINIPSPDSRPHRLRVPSRESRGFLQHNTYHVLKLFL